MMNNLKRNAIIVEIEQGVNGTIDAVSLNPIAKDIGLDFNDDGQNEWTARRIAGYDSKIK